MVEQSRSLTKARESLQSARGRVGDAGATVDAAQARFEGAVASAAERVTLAPRAAGDGEDAQGASAAEEGEGGDGGGSLGEALQAHVSASARELGIPGAAVGVWWGGEELYACHGVTSVENPLAVDEHTLFLLGSVSKTYTATTLMCLVSRGEVKLSAPVRLYVPELALSDERVAAEITVAQLLNHTAGLDWGLILDTGEGDGALAEYVARMSELQLIGEPGARASYSQAGFNLLGRIIERVTGLTFERAVASLVLEPLGLEHTFYARDDVMTRRFCVGHNRDEDETLSIARLWRRARGDNPGGGVVSSVAEQLRWARFHLGDGSVRGGGEVLHADLLDRMKEPTVALRGSNLGDAIGIAWFLRDVGGVRAIGHGGSANGQFADLLIVPERDFAVVAMSNAGPEGIPFNQAAIRWALRACLEITDSDPEPLAFDASRAREIVGAYENDVMTLTITGEGDALAMAVLIKPEIRATADKDLPPDHAPFVFGLLAGGGEEYVITHGAFKGQRGFFTRDEHGEVVGVDLAGRLFNRVRAGAR